VPIAVVVLRAGTEASEAELLDFCIGRLARYKVPVGVQFRKELPRTASGKLQRRLLRD